MGGAFTRHSLRPPTSYEGEQLNENSGMRAAGTMMHVG